MRECSVCNRLFDDGFSVFAPPCQEAFDRIECARRAAAVWAADERLAPILLPTVEALRPHSEPLPALVGRRLSIAALAVSALVPAQTALAGGAALLTGGTAASVYLVAKPAPGAEASKPAVRMQSSTASRATSPQIPAGSVFTASAASLHRDALASPDRTLAPRHASRDKVTLRPQISVARGATVAKLPSRTVPGQLAVPQRPTQNSTEPPTAIPMTKPSPEPTLPKPKPADAQKPRDVEKPRHTQKPKHNQKPTDSQKPKDSNKPRDTHKPRDRPTDTAKPNPSATKTPTVEHQSPPNRQAAPPSAPESQPPTTAPSTNSEAPPHGPPDGQPGPPDQNGSHGEGNGNGNHGGNGHGHGH